MQGKRRSISPATGWHTALRQAPATSLSARSPTTPCSSRAHSGYAGAHPADRSFATSLASAGGGVGLRDPSGVLADSVAWGTATNAFVEGAVAPAPTIAPAPGKSAGRHPNGQDTNDNAADFTEGEPSPGGAN